MRSYAAYTRPYVSRRARYMGSNLRYPAAKNELEPAQPELQFRACQSTRVDSGSRAHKGHNRGRYTSERTIARFDAQMSLDLNADLDGTVPLAPVAGSGNTHTCLVECRQRTTKFPRLSTRGMFCLSRSQLSLSIPSRTSSGLAQTRDMCAQTIHLVV